MDFLDALTFDNPFSPPASSMARFTDTLTQLPFIPTLETPNTSSVRDTYWPSPRSSSPLLSSPSPTNTVQDFTVHRGPPTAQVSFQGSYPSDFRPFPHDGGPAITPQHHEAVVPYSQHIAPFRIDFNPASKEKKRPPRPSNAFMLFRSDFLKRKLISKDQETRQHRLSIIAAKCWHRLSKEEKTKWFLEAEREKKRHALKYVDYKFQPRRRTKTRCEPKPASPPEEFESLCRLADMAYQEMINDDLARENANSPSTISTSIPGSPTPSPTPQIDMAERPFLEGYKEWPAFDISSAANLSVRSAQIPYIATGTDAVRDAGAMSSSQIRCHSSQGDRVQATSNRLPGMVVDPPCTFPKTFPTQGTPQAPVPLARAYSTNSFLDSFTTFDSSARLLRGLFRAPLPTSLTQNSLANA